MQVRFPSAERDFLPRVNFQCRLSFGVCTSLCAIACINICAHDRDPAVNVRVWWIMATQTYPALTVSDKNNQLDDCGRSTETRTRAILGSGSQHSIHKQTNKQTNKEERTLTALEINILHLGPNHIACTHACAKLTTMRNT